MTVERATDITVRRATSDDHTDVLSVLDGANLETDADAIRTTIDRDACVVAEPSADSDGDAPLIGALVRDENEITHVAVRRRRRGQGIGSALVEAITEDRDSIVAEFPTDVRPFYEALGFDIESADEDGRLRGRLRSDERVD